ncbi:hypothetical protein EI42_06118 [Thermosporothrix hazakensis]|jgi:hypothetical protein|uniref:Uncharacterized protein n=1 Tax=Thermosporothrix hazakensis TaxID=644383 RepID=A0A326TVC6_THEHA|nr:hypothetical protein [Thermosporothrix hazakensis]PZW19364.1 hypothetical protein EI42_06118 [Thermosporothrix hazakensis]
MKEALPTIIVEDDPIIQLGLKPSYSASRAPLGKTPAFGRFSCWYRCASRAWN